MRWNESSKGLGHLARWLVTPQLMRRAVRFHLGAEDKIGAFLLLVTLAIAASVVNDASAQVPVLPEGAATHWVVDQPEEIVGYLLFDPATVERRLPPTLRFITIEELAAGGVVWAMEYLVESPIHGHWGISLFEIVQMQTFTIDGHAPQWPDNGAVALWIARVAPSDATTDLGSGVPLLTLEFWIPDSSYAVEMRDKGHYATGGDVRLHQDSAGKWWGSVDIDGLSVVAECTPTGVPAGAAGSRGMQSFFPPHSSTVTSIVRVAFAGHREQRCEEDSSWQFHGAHPLTGVVALGPSTFQFGYDLIGGAYRR